MAQERVRLGILMLSSRFPRIPGDVGNRDTWDFPVRFAVVPGATPQSIVRADPEPHVQAFIAAGRDLVASGCTGLATTCGFLAPLRKRLAEALQVPVAASALEQAAGVQAMLPPGRRVGILTISKAQLTSVHLSTAGVPETAQIAGVDGSSFAQSIMHDAPTLDVAAARAEITQACNALVQRHRDIGAILLECTNMVPYAADVARATGLPVYSIYSYLNWFHAGLAPATFPAQSRSQPSLNA
jgi:Asp/Glu/hydantoin racemase